MQGSRFQRWIQLFRDNRTGLTILSILALLRGISYLPFFTETDRKPAHFFEEIISVNVWAGVWIGIGVIGIIFALVNRLVPSGFGLTVGIHAAWAMSFLLGTFFGENSRAWVSALGYIGVAVVTLWALSRGRREEVTLTLKNR